MTFTDDELKRLKEFLAHDCKTCEDKPTPMPFNGSPFERTKALLARLEAAERVIENPHHPSHEYPEEGCPGCEALEAWRKAADR